MVVEVIWWCVRGVGWGGFKRPRPHRNSLLGRIGEHVPFSKFVALASYSSVFVPRQHVVEKA